MKILFHYDAGDWLKGKVSALVNEGLDVVCCEENNDQRFFEELQDSDILWHVLRPVDRTVLEQAPQLKLVQKIGVGVNTIDLDAARERGVRVCNMPGTNSQAVAEMVLLLMLATLRQLPLMQRTVRSGQWYTDIEVQSQLSELHGKTVGFFGFGAVPQVLSPILEAKGADIIYHTRQQKETVSYPYKSFHELLAEADILSLHVPLTAETVNIIDRDTIGMMKPDSILINTARGQLVREADLYAALKNGNIAAAGLDVFSEEPVVAHNPLFDLDNVIVTPHVAWLTRETWKRSLDVAVDNVLAVRERKPLVFQIC